MIDLIIGCGETGVRVAARAVAAGDQVVGVVRTQSSAARVRGVGAQARVIDLDSDIPRLPRCDRLFYFAPPQREGHRDERMARVLAGIQPAPPVAVYISTSGVYGDCGGEWVDEDRPLAPTTDRALRRVDSERQIRAFCGDAVILRAPGIYGPSRLPVDRVRAGEPIVDDEDAGWTNRVHIDDLARMAWNAGVEAWPRRIYNACDGNPTRMGAYYDALAELLGVAPPPRISWAEAVREFSEIRLSFLRESRRLSNRRLREDTGFECVFADFRDGLEASLMGEPPAEQNGY